MEREIKRGDIYEVLFGDELTTLCAHRPMLVVSCDKANAGNTPYVMVIPLTTKFRYGVISPIINSMGKQAWSKCDQVQCVAKERLEQYKGSATDAEMEAVDRGLRAALQLNSTTEEEDSEKEYLEKEVESLKAQLESKEKESPDTSITVSRDMYKRLYEKALEELASVRFDFDLENKKETKVVEKPKAKVVEEPKVSVVVKPPEVGEQKVEINTCSAEELRRIGCSPTMIHNLIFKRPYKSVEDLKAVPGFTRIGYKLIEGRVCCIPKKKPSSGKLNINTATLEEMKEVLGLSHATAQNIRAYRNKNGNFKSLEELTNVPRFGHKCLEKYGPKMEV